MDQFQKERANRIQSTSGHFNVAHKGSCWEKRVYREDEEISPWWGRRLSHVLRIREGREESLKKEMRFETNLIHNSNVTAWRFGDSIKRVGLINGEFRMNVNQESCETVAWLRVQSEVWILLWRHDRNAWMLTLLSTRLLTKTVPSRNNGRVGNKIPSSKTR